MSAPVGGIPREASFAPGDSVRVLDACPPGHVRTPWFLRGRQGRVDLSLGHYPDPETGAYGRPGQPLELYRVRFRQADLWPGYAGAPDDTLVADLYQSWLRPSPGEPM